LDECGQKQFRRDAWEAVLRRLSLEQGRVLGTTTLYSAGWLKTEIYDPWANGNPDIDVIQFDSLANPAFPLEEFNRAKATMPGWRFDLFYRGQFSKPAGLIYDSFDLVNSVVESFKIPEHWPVYIGHDFGPVNTVGLWYALCPETGEFFLFQEYRQPGLAIHEHLENWRKISAGCRIMKRAGGSRTEDGWRAAYTGAGWRIDKPTITEVEVGIQNVYGFHKINKIKVFRNCLGYLDEKQSYSREIDDMYHPTDKIENKSKYHFMDAERYILGDFTPVSIGPKERNIIKLCVPRGRG
jgi:hypothetical protein